MRMPHLHVDPYPFCSMWFQPFHHSLLNTSIAPLISHMSKQLQRNWSEKCQLLFAISSPFYTSGSDQSIPPQCTSPGRASNVCLVFQRSSGLPVAEGGQFLIPARKQLCILPQCSRDVSKFVYLSLYPTPYLLPNVRCDGFPSREKFMQVPVCTIIYSNPVSVCVYVIQLVDSIALIVCLHIAIREFTYVSVEAILLIMQKFVLIVEVLILGS